jgi:Flp pilus assembly protein TadD
MRSHYLVQTLILTCVIGLAACTGATSEGPTDTELQAAARAHYQQQIAQSGLEGAERAAYEAATFAPGARCVRGANDVYTCETEVTMTLPGESPMTQPAVIEVVKRDGEWQTVAP